MCEVCRTYDEMIETLKKALIDRSVLTDEFIQELIDKVESDKDAFLDAKFDDF